MLKLFKAKKTPAQIVAEIHNEFDSASERLLKEAKALLNSKDTSKGERLKQLGFVNAKPVKEIEDLRQKEWATKQLAENVSYFSQWYPNNKFITEDAVKQICEKYGLVFGDAVYYKGDVPEKNLKEMEQFKLRQEDMDKRTGLEDYHERRMRGFMMRISPLLGMDGFIGEPMQRYEPATLSTDDIFRLQGQAQYTQKPFKICAPEKDFEMRHLVKKGYKLEYDPIVLQPVKGGYLIVTKWGLEASDEIVRNEKMN